MKVQSRILLRSVLIMVSVSAAGCGSHGGFGTLGMDGEEASQRHVSSEIDNAMSLLNAGDEVRARLVLADYIKANPKSATAKRLFAQIDEEPEALLGSTFQAYTVKRGDTMSELAARFAGDRLLFYALTRHNGLKSPQALTAGTVIEVPQPSIVKAPTPANANATPSPTEAKKVVSNEDRTAAQKLRRTALKHLNNGEAERAVSLLQQAQALSADDKAILADLARAERIMRTVEERSQ